MAKVKVLEIDQWASTGNVEDFTLDNFDRDKVHGGDAEAAQAIVLGSFRGEIREVEENWEPPYTKVWYRPTGPGGKLHRWKTGIPDSSG